MKPCCRRIEMPSAPSPQPAIQGDLYIRNCSPPPRLVVSQTFMCQSIDSDWLVGQKAAAVTAAAEANAASLDTLQQEQLPLVLVNPDMREAITELPYPSNA